ncbi:hypothetical protein ACFE04_019092 [Oxalis oulophora]
METQSGKTVNFSEPRSSKTRFLSGFKETFFPDDPFYGISKEAPLRKAKRIVEYFLPVVQWLPKYNLDQFKFDLLAGITITSLAIPQGISYAKLANLPPIIGLYSSFVPPLIYAVFGSSKHLAVGTVAACSLLIAATIGGMVSPKDDPELYLHLIYTATFFTGIFQLLLGLLRLGILVDFLSHSTITGFMGGTAVIICLQQLKGIFGMIHFTTKTDVVHVLRAIFKNRHEWRWESATVGITFLFFLQSARYLGKKKPNLAWVSTIAPMVTVIVGCLFAYFGHVEKHGIQIVGPLKKGVNPISIHFLNFDSKYLSVTLQTGIITGLIALAEGIAIGRSFATMTNQQVDGNKEMVAFGLMNLAGSLTSCYLTTGPFSKTAVNFNAGCKTAMSNVVMSLCMLLTLLFLAPVFSYTPLVALSAIIMSAMLGLIKYEEAYHLFKVDKFDFSICMVAFFGVAFLDMETGLMLSVGLSLIRALLYVARPATCKLGKLADTRLSLYRDIEQYPETMKSPGILALQLGSPIYYANSTYIRERILRWIREEQRHSEHPVEHLLLDLSGVTSIDTTGIHALEEIHRIVSPDDIKIALVNPRIKVMEKLILSNFVEVVRQECIFLSIDDAIAACKFSLHTS